MVVSQNIPSLVTIRSFRAAQHILEYRFCEISCEVFFSSLCPQVELHNRLSRLMAQTTRCGSKNHFWGCIANLLWRSNEILFENSKKFKDRQKTKQKLSTGAYRKSGSSIRLKLGYVCFITCRDAIKKPINSHWKRCQTLVSELTAVQEHASIMSVCYHACITTVAPLYFPRRQDIQLTCTNS